MKAVAIRTFTPAFQYDWALPLFEPFVRLVGVDQDLRAAVDLAGFQPGQRLLDIGCGTGMLAIYAKRTHPTLDVTGLDPDPAALRHAQRNAQRDHLTLHWHRGFSDELSYADESFDHVTSTFMFHHLSDNERGQTLRQVHRVLKPSGTFHLVDFSERKAGSLRDRIFPQGDRYDDDNTKFLSVMRQAGFADVTKVRARSVTLIGQVAHYQAHK